MYWGASIMRQAIEIRAGGHYDDIDVDEDDAAYDGDRSVHHGGGD